MTPSKAMVEKLLRACKTAGQDEVATLLHRMAKTCLSCAENPTGHLWWSEELRDVASLRRDLERLEKRTGLELEIDSIPLATPAREFAVAAGMSCLELEQRIEGESTRIQHLRAYYCRTQGALEEATDRLERMLRGRLDKSWYGTVQEGRQFALLGLSRHSQVADIADKLLAVDSHRLTSAFNLATAAAWMGNSSQFDAAAARFKALLPQVNAQQFWQRVVADEAQWFAGCLSLDPSAVVKCFMLPSPLTAPPRREA